MEFLDQMSMFWCGFCVAMTMWSGFSILKIIIIFIAGFFLLMLMEGIRQAAEGRK